MLMSKVNQRPVRTNYGKKFRKDFLSLLLSNFRNYGFTFAVHIRAFDLDLAVCKWQRMLPAKWHKSGNPKWNKTQNLCDHGNINLLLGCLFNPLWQWDSFKVFRYQTSDATKNISTDWFITAECRRAFVGGKTVFISELASNHTFCRAGKQQIYVSDINEGMILTNYFDCQCRKTCVSRVNTQPV